MRQLTRSIILGLAILAGTQPSRAQIAPAGATLPQLTRMDLAVKIDYGSERLAGTATVTVKNASRTSLAHVPFLLNRLMRAEAVRDRRGRSLAFRQRPVVFEDEQKLQVNAIEVDLPDPLPPEAAVQLSIDFGGFLVGYTEVGWLYVKDRIARDFTILREDAFAFPIVGVPSEQVNRAAPREAFEFEASVTVPEDLVVATGGNEIARSVSGGLATWRYRSRGPAPFLIITIAPYRVAEADGLRIFHFADDADGARRVLQAAQRASARYAEIFGPLNRPIALNVMEIPEGWGSQGSLTGGIIQEAGTFRDRAQLAQVYHELSHLWNAADLDAPSPRWNEGLAMFLQDRLARELDGWDGEAAALQRTAARLLEACGAGQPCGRVPLRQYGAERLTDFSYPVGRLMFAALYRALGQAPFDRALRQHYQSHKVSGTRTTDLVGTFVEVGGPAARRIFEDWLDSTEWVHRLRDTPSPEALFDSYRR